MDCNDVKPGDRVKCVNVSQIGRYPISLTKNNVYMVANTTTTRIGHVSICNDKNLIRYYRPYRFKVVKGKK